MSALLEQVEAMLQGIIDTRVREASEAIAADFVRDRDALNSQIRAWQAAEAKALKQRDLAIYDAKVWKQAMEDVRSERDAARAELAGVAAQRDAHLSRSVELAARVTELEAA